jgi:hypothetical protein
VETNRLMNEAIGYGRLGMLHEAEALLEQITSAEEAAYLAAQNALLGIYLSRHECQKAADTGRLLILQDLFDIGIVERTMMALTFIGRHEEARETLALVERFNRPLIYHAYQMACFESLAGNFSDSLRWLETELQNPRYFSARSVGDSDLFPLWRWLAKDRLGVEDAHRIFQMNLDNVCVTACNPKAEVRLDQNDLKGVPEEVQDLFRFNFTAGLFELDSRAVAENSVIARKFRNCRARHIARISAMIRAGVKQALEVVLESQPQYAAEQAAWGNHLGARYHILWGLARKPEMLGSFYAEPGLDPMNDLLDSLADVQLNDPGFCARMDVVGDLVFVDLEEAWKTLEQTPNSARGHPLFQLRQAMVYGNDNDHDRALPLYLTLCETWPDDAVGFANACDCLIKLGRWTDAERVLERAPDCYQQFQLYHRQRENLRNRTLNSPMSKIAPFRGQRGLDGLLIPPSAHRNAVAKSLSGE